MLNNLVKDLGVLTIFMICAQMIIFLRPRQQYEKYLKLMVNLLILLQFLGLFKKYLSSGEPEAMARIWEEDFYLEEAWGDAWQDGAMEDVGEGGDGAGDDGNVGIRLEEIEPIGITVEETDES